jgi:hypothetical protein
MEADLLGIITEEEDVETPALGARGWSPGAVHGWAAAASVSGR